MIHCILQIPTLCLLWPNHCKKIYFECLPKMVCPTRVEQTIQVNFVLEIVPSEVGHQKIVSVTFWAIEDIFERYLLPHSFIEIHSKCLKSTTLWSLITEQLSCQAVQDYLVPSSCTLPSPPTHHCPIRCDIHSSSILFLLSCHSFRCYNPLCYLSVSYICSFFL